MTAESPVSPTLIETATRIEQRRQESERRERLITIALIIALSLFALVSNLIAYHLIRGLIEDVERQNAQLAVSIDENRLIAAQNADRQDRILLAIGDRLVPKAEVRKLDQNVVKLRREAARLRAAVRRLNLLLRARAVAGGG